ncbi:MAG: alpha-1,4-glucan--maltose-1-phosphate maltosyltransferase [Ancrocorticia sp.]|uniref:alpha-1,4-glucan--maltose-1-phosphate maltosyltransferase n=2 Tax=Ancrocorticia sp. TaxID=2593684 RepID=UPI003F9244DC
MGRIPIRDIEPSVENGSWAAKGTELEAFPVRATVFREGHDLFAAEAVLVDPHGNEVQTEPMVLIRPGLGRYEAWLTPTYPGAWTYFVRSYSDPIATWEHNAQARIGADTDIELVFLEAEAWMNRALTTLEAAVQSGATDADMTALKDALDVIHMERLSPTVRFEAATAAGVRTALVHAPVRDMVTESSRFPVNVDRSLALAGSWYEIFPRSHGSYQDQDGTWVSGTLATAAQDLGRIAGMGFDVVYLTPVSPIGTTNRKGRNNTLEAAPGDPGSPYAIGSADGGHDAIHPELGTFEDFDQFVASAKSYGMEVALDFALQCSPDHPWLTEHPEWFTTRADGTIAFAENPPKKYQDIYPLNFDNDPEGIYQEIVRVLEVWISHGVTIFRVDNPHTKPVQFWQRLMAQFRIEHPDILFLAEAFTAPPMMQGLGAVGFHQSYCYFAWRTEKEEIEEYLQELATESDHLLRPAFWPTTHDILTPFMQDGGKAAFELRAVLAATGAPTYGIYSGYELVENVARPGFEEQIDNEKYEFKPRNWQAGEHTGIPQLLTQLNRIRHAHPSLQRLRGIRINPTSSDQIISYTRFARPEEVAGKAGAIPEPLGGAGSPAADAVITVINLDPHNGHDAVLDLDLSPFGVTPGWAGEPLFEVTDELTGQTFLWNEHPYVSLNPGSNVAHVLSVRVISD